MSWWLWLLLLGGGALFLMARGARTDAPSRAENFDDDETDDIYDETHDDEDAEYYGEDSDAYYEDDAREEHDDGYEADDDRTDP